MKRKRKIRGGTLAALACLALGAWMHAASGKLSDDSALSAAICPIVYPVDQTPSAQGYHYLFYGNGFFINEQGYLLTAAHVLSQLHGGQPYVLLRPLEGPPRIVPAALVAADREHDVAILRATPNPFEANYKVAFLPLAEEWVVRGSAVLAASVHPSKPLNAYTLDASIEDRTSGEVFAFPFSQLEKRSAETELFLFNHQVRRGQSGSPVVSAETHAVVGLVEGEWLRSSLVSLTTTADQTPTGTGAAIPIHYAIALLQQKNVVWHTASRAPGASENSSSSAEGFSPPAPVSLVAAPFPSQALFGGEVALDALIDTRGRVAETKVVRGEAPFLEKALASVRTWSFAPARQDGTPVAARVGIIFQFSQSYEPPRPPKPHKYEEPMPAAADRGALPVVTIEPQGPAPNVEDASVILKAGIGRDGQVGSVEVLRDTELLAAPATAAVERWTFVPAKRGGTATESPAIIVIAFRHAGNAQQAPRKN
ncbi:MAG TPA: energy transducer TonB [Candidatus Sulfotelmatobacter sp.]|nr:energy transducer TonB [Candidatus Sulfotelmatobacter sp.]